MLFAHPLRLRLFLRIVEDGETSPKELAAASGAPPNSVAYHVRALADLGLVECVREEQRRGATEHYYVATTTPKAPEWRSDRPRRLALAEALGLRRDHLRQTLGL